MATGSYDDVDAAQVRLRALWIRWVDSSLKKAVRARSHHECQIWIAGSQDRVFRREVADDAAAAGKAGITSMRSYGIRLRLLLVARRACFGARVGTWRRDFGLVWHFRLDLLGDGGPQRHSE